MIVVSRHGVVPGELSNSTLQIITLAENISIRIKNLFEIFQFLRLGLDLLGNVDSFINEVHHPGEVVFTESSAGQGWSSQPHTSRY